MQLHMSGETIETLLYRENNPILELKISYPQVMGPLSKESEYRFNERYRNNAYALNQKARTEFYHKALEEYQCSRKQEFHFTLHSFLRTFTITRLDARYTSLYFDRYYYSGGMHGITVRTGNTWDFSKGGQVPLSYYFYTKSNYRKIILREIFQQIESQKEKEGIFFFENPFRKAIRHFHETDYYLTHNAIVVYYQLYTLAPYHVGNPTFEIPFSVLDRCWIKSRKPTEIAPYVGSFSQNSDVKLL